MAPALPPPIIAAVRRLSMVVIVSVESRNGFTSAARSLKKDLMRHVTNFPSPSAIPEIRNRCLTVWCMNHRNWGIRESYGRRSRNGLPGLMARLAAVEGGGTTFVVAIASDPTTVLERAEFPTTTPKETLRKCREWLVSRHYDALVDSPRTTRTRARAR